MKKIGIIGCGNMGESIIKGILSSNFIDPNKINLYDIDKNKMTRIEKKYGGNICIGEKDLTKSSEVIILGIKPYLYENVLTEISDVIKDDAIIVSISPGIKIDKIEKIVGNNKKIVRTMPNTPISVGEGMTAICTNKNINKTEELYLLKLFNNFGKCELVSENLLDTVVGLSGSAPAYAYLFIEAMADAGVLQGMPREKAYSFAAQSLLGAAKMVLESGKHPGQLKDEVTSPGGTTIEGIKILEEKGFRGIVIDTINATIERSKDLGK